MSATSPATETSLVRSQLLAALPGVIHAITHRVFGMGLAHGNIGYSAPRDRDDAWAMRQAWCVAAGIPPERLVTLGQIHGNEVLVAEARHAGWGATPGSRQIGLGDALVTNTPGPVLLTLHADCQPVLLVDPARNGRGPVVAVAHAGWRGTVADVVGRTVAVMGAAFGTRPTDIHAYLGPAIGGCCYEIGDEVVGAWERRAGADAAAALVGTERGVNLSLSAANALLLERAGLRGEHVEVTSACTRCHEDRWFSHRAQGPRTGRFGAMIAIQSGPL